MGIFDKLFRKKKKKEESFNVEELKEKRDIDGLTKALREDPEKGNISNVTPLTMAAVSALGEIGDEEAVNALIDVLEWKNLVEKIRHSTSGTSLEYDAQTGFFVSKELRDEFEFTRIGAAKALAKIGEDRGTEYLLQSLKDNDFYIRKAAAISLANLGDRRSAKTLIECLDFHVVYIDVIEALGELKSPEAGSPLTRIIGSGNAEARRAAAEALGKIGDTKAVKPLILALMEEPITEKVAKALHDLGVSEAIITKGLEFAEKRDSPWLGLSGDEIRFANKLAEEALETI